MPLKIGITLHCSWCFDGFVELLEKYVAGDRAENYQQEDREPEGCLTSLRPGFPLPLPEIVSASST